jgi:tetratricopeptide (TPR) repeat protein
MHLRDAATASNPPEGSGHALSLIFRRFWNLNALAGDSLTARPASLKIGYLFLLVFSVCYPLQAQTYEIGPSAAQQPASPSAPKASQKSSSRTGQAPAPNESLGWGSNIQDARIARGAEMALKQGNHPLAVSLAQRAAQAAPNDPQLWILLGYAARLNRQYALSVDAYSHGLRLKPSSLEGMSGLAQTYSVIGKTDEAMRLLKQVITADPRRTDDALLLGELTMRSGDYTGALDYFRKAEQVKPGVRPELLMALSYQHLKQFDQANHYLEMAKRHAPNNPEVLRSLAGYYLETGSYAEAITMLKSIHNPRPDVLAELAYVYQLDGNAAESARFYTQAANAMPKDLALQLSAAQAQVTIGSIEKANQFLERATHLDPEHYRLHAIRGEIARLEDRDADAVKEYTAVLAHMPPNPAEGPLYGIQVHMDLMDLYQNLKQPDVAREQLDIARTQIGTLDERGPDRLSFLRLRASIKMHLNDLDGAGSDLKEALAINPKDPNALQLDGDLLMKLGRTEEAIAVYSRILSIDPKNRFALTSLGYASRTAGRDQDAEKYFRRLAEVDPKLYVPYAALGDMYTARRDFAKAESNYSKAHQLAPKNALVVAGGLNAAIEAHKLDLAGVWASRVTEAMQDEPQVLREEERYLSFKGDYRQSATIGEKVLPLLPKDRDVVVYLGYDLLNLQRYDELLKLTSQYSDVLSKEPDLPLLAGYVHKHNGQLEEARADFTKALERDPEVVTAYVNRGYVEHDLGQSRPAAADFEAALKRDPNNGEAHLGLAYASLDLHRSQVALKESQLAERYLGDSEPLHLIRGTAYGQRGQLAKAATEYRLALKFSPDDPSLHLALASVLYSQRRYHESIDELQVAHGLAPTDASIYAMLARAYAQLGDREQTLKNVELAEQNADRVPSKPNHPGSGPSAIYLSTGSALSVLGDQNGAMERFRRALTAPNSDRVGVRLAIAQIMARQDRADDAKRQIALGLMEAEAGETTPATGEQLIQAADVFRGVHDYELSQTYLERARAVGASDTAVRVGMANNYTAIGDTARAQAELAGISRDADSDPDYRYLLAEANVYRQQHHTAEALTAFAQASDAAGEDQTAEEGLLSAGADEGLRINPRVSLLSNFAVSPIFEDTTVYVLDSKLDGTTPVPITDTSLLPPPRSSLQTQWTAAYHLHLNYLPTASGFFQLRNARGTISVPATSSIANRNTTDYSFNFGLNPTVHLGSNSLTFNSGIQATIRRDSLSPAALNQNLFREFTYMTTSSFFNAVSVSGFIMHESGPFTDMNLHSRTLAGAVDFRVGEPWGKTALLTGWAASDQQFQPANNVNFYTSSYIGLQHRFSERLDVRAIAEDLRTWRIVGARYGISQALRPAGQVEFSPTRNWRVEGTVAYNNTRGFHVYDAIHSGFAVSYAMPFRRAYRDENGEVPLQYPIRFSAGMQQESFFNFPGTNNEQFRPYFSISLF